MRKRTLRIILEDENGDVLEQKEITYTGQCNIKHESSGFLTKLVCMIFGYQDNEEVTSLLDTASSMTSDSRSKTPFYTAV